MHFTVPFLDNEDPTHTRVIWEEGRVWKIEPFEKEDQKFSTSLERDMSEADFLRMDPYNCLKVLWYEKREGDGKDVIALFQNDLCLSPWFFF
jgi:hypothetical protein